MTAVNEQDYRANHRPVAGEHTSSIRSVASKASYVRRTRRKLASIRSRLHDIRSEVINGLAAGRLQLHNGLMRLQRSIETHQRDAEMNLDKLRKSGIDEWEDLRLAVDECLQAFERAVAELASLAAGNKT